MLKRNLSKSFLKIKNMFPTIFVYETKFKRSSWILNILRTTYVNNVGKTYTKTAMMAVNLILKYFVILINTNPGSTNL